MKKYLILLLTALSVSFTSCDNETEPGGTAVEKMAGDWWVTATIMQNGNEVGDSGAGHFRMYTYNTAANVPTEMWLEDGGNFRNYKVRVNVDYNARTFTTNDFVEGVRITEGKIMEGAATTPSGMPADSIVYMIQFDDDPNGLTYKVSGFRRTGFPNDDF
ncbi:lipid-binding protein [Phocaeicola faecium]|uniref:Lipid-binding hydrolase n=1 Tax=Phocaeicola faecium TaxID=2762213 RepID=A0ABR8VAH4_9BACT|nr:lipid-binding protein [Phocaeicola faecium]MBD8001784.1 hypothetical protein [Phocaeicola faecium]